MDPRDFLPALLRKEVAWGRRNLVPLVVLLLVLPGAFAYGSLAFQTVLPTDAPVAIVPQDDSVSADDMTIARGAVAPFATPRTYRDRAAAFDALEREQVYAVVTVPPDITDPDVPATFQVSVSGSVVPYHQASQAVVSVMNFVLESQLPDEHEVSVERHVVGTERALSAYLVPTFFFALLSVVALVYLPYNLAGERAVIDRLRVESSLSALVGWKLTFFTALLAVPAVVFQLASQRFGYDVAAASPGALLVAGLTFLTLGAVALSLTLVTRFSALGRLLSLAVLLFVLAFSGLFYPAGFFSPARRELVRTVPTHYAMVALRGFALRDAALGTYADWLAGLGALAVLALVVLRGSIAVYERGA